VASKNRGEFMADLKRVCKAETVEGAETALDELEKNGEKNTRLPSNRGGKNGPSTAKLEFDIVTALDLF
jgi:hypothetical protein